MHYCICIKYMLLTLDNRIETGRLSSKLSKSAFYKAKPISSGKMKAMPNRTEFAGFYLKMYCIRSDW